MNAMKSGMLMILMTVLFLLVGGMVGGQTGMVIAFGLAVILNGFSYWFSDRIVLKMYRAKEVSEADAPELVGIVRELATAAALPMPRVYIIPDATPNAFATGRNPTHSAVAVTEGLLRTLDSHEVKGVLGHELAHVQHRDILVGSVVAVLAGAIMMLASMARWAAIFGGVRSGDDDNGGFLGLMVAAIVAPIAAVMIQMAISRSREFMADEAGARIAGNPEFLASALQKLEMSSRRVGVRGAGPQTAHMFIVNPLKGRAFARMFSTHPPTEERVRRLRELRLG